MTTAASRWSRACLPLRVRFLESLGIRLFDVLGEVVAAVPGRLESEIRYISRSSDDSHPYPHARSAANRHRLLAPTTAYLARPRSANSAAAVQSPSAHCCSAFAVGGRARRVAATLTGRGAAMSTSDADGGERCGERGRPPDATSGCGGREPDMQRGLLLERTDSHMMSSSSDRYVTSSRLAAPQRATCERSGRPRRPKASR